MDERGARDGGAAQRVRACGCGAHGDSARGAIPPNAAAISHRAKLAVALVALGAAGGPLSMALLRDREPFETAHAWFATLALVLFLATAWLGRRLERGRGRPLDAHALLAALALLAAGVAAVTGFVLLP